MLQAFADITDGKKARIGSQGMAKIGGILPWGETLIVSVYHHYDATAETHLSHFVSGRNLADPGDVQGPFELDAPKRYAAFVAGYMANVPAEHQAALGGPAVTGGGPQNIIWRTSYGPGLFAFTPQHLIDQAFPVTPTIPLLYYPAENPLAPFPGKVPSPYFNANTRVKGLMFAGGSVVFFGFHAPDATLEYQRDGVPGYWQSTANVPYYWAYKVSDLAAVARGEVKPWVPRPYEVGTLTLPGTQTGDIVGVAYDPETRRLFLSQNAGESPRCHIYQVA